MRSEQEILKSVLDAAWEDDGVRAVIRTNLLPVREYLASYNFYFIVNDPEKYDCDELFASRFGDRILLFRGDRNYPEMFPDSKAHLMVFRDGVTLVIHAMGREAFLRRYRGEEEHENVWIGDTYRKLLDKDGILPEIERLEETQTVFDQVPAEADYIGANNEFWWVLKTFAEYTLREELPSAMFYLHAAVRDMLHKMLRWHIRLRYGRPVDMGILDSRMELLLEEELFRLYKKTFPDAEYAHIWDAFDAVVLLWRETGSDVAERCGFRYPLETERDMLEFIRGLRELKEKKR